MSYKSTRPGYPCLRPAHAQYKLFKCIIGVIDVIGKYTRVIKGLIIYINARRANIKLLTFECFSGNTGTGRWWTCRCRTAVASSRERSIWPWPSAICNCTVAFGRRMSLCTAVASWSRDHSRRGRRIQMMLLRFAIVAGAVRIGRSHCSRNCRRWRWRCRRRPHNNIHWYNNIISINAVHVYR